MVLFDGVIRCEGWGCVCFGWGGGWCVVELVCYGCGDVVGVLVCCIWCGMGWVL